MAERIVVLGAVALGPKAAARCKRLAPHAQVTLVDQAERISYGGCGIPYYVSGEVSRLEELQETPYKTLRDSAFFKSHKGIETLTRTQALSIDRVAKTVQLRDLACGNDYALPYDKLVLATGARPRKLAIAGAELRGVTAASCLEDAQAIRETVASGQVNHAVVVGAGFIGLEMAVALADMWGISVSLIELAPQIMPGVLSPSLAAMLRKDLENNNVTVYTDEKVLRMDGENGTVSRVLTDKHVIDAELVIMAVGVCAESSLARDAGLAVSESGLICVDRYMRTSDPDIYAGGDVVAVPNLITGKSGWFPLGSMANRQGRVIGTNLAGGNDEFPGAVGAWGVKLLGLSAAGAGLIAETARKEGFDPITVHIEQMDKAHFYPEKDLMALELVVDKATRRVLGVQGVCANGDSLVARINAVVPLLARNAVISDISNLELVYTPPFASAMDCINTLGNVADNIVSGRYHPLSQPEFQELWEQRSEETVWFLDTRSHADAAQLLQKYPEYWHSIPQDEIVDRLKELPEGKPLVVICNTGLRAYEAQLLLDANGVGDVRVLEGGVSSARRMGTAL